jgi:hypothetical protein
MLSSALIELALTHILETVSLVSTNVSDYISEGLRRPDCTRRDRTIEARNQNLPEAFDATFFILRKFIKMKDYPRSKSIELSICRFK